MDDAKEFLRTCPHKSEVSWYALISALASTGGPVEALVIFDCMSKKVGPGLKDITFLRDLVEETWTLVRKC